MFTHGMQSGNDAGRINQFTRGSLLSDGDEHRPLHGLGRRLRFSAGERHGAKIISHSCGCSSSSPFSHGAHKSRPMATRSCLDAWWLGVLSYTFVMGFALPFMQMTVSYAALLLTPRSQRSDPNTEPREPPTGAAGHQKWSGSGGCVYMCWLPLLHLSTSAPCIKVSGLTFARALSLWSCCRDFQVELRLTPSPTPASPTLQEVLQDLLCSC
ncbi:somatostatin receptor type 2-like protein [Lates japonicus]|uniref:Somatostatin receptor type 2-like protein n=1 Tax=Lates japonicus TaxID=270547 RepID=A0AAD3MPA0_LATJO|nr:somatostatin receptor type 2-like protein [Lates japonicus]